jgi:hypothetical protein
MTHALLCYRANPRVRCTSWYNGVKRKGFAARVKLLEMMKRPIFSIPKWISCFIVFLAAQKTGTYDGNKGSQVGKKGSCRKFVGRRAGYFVHCKSCGLMKSKFKSKKTDPLNRINT